MQAAWAALGDPGQRAAYDRRAALRALRLEVHINETLDLEEMEACEDAGGSGLPGFSWPCRCGGAYGLVGGDAAGGGGRQVDVPCSTCSLYVRVKT